MYLGHCALIGTKRQTDHLEGIFQLCNSNQRKKKLLETDIAMKDKKLIPTQKMGQWRSSCSMATDPVGKRTTDSDQIKTTVMHSSLVHC